MFGGTGPLTIDCNDSLGVGNKACANMTVTGMSGLLTMTCDGVSSCAQASITGGSSLTTVICEQTSACQAATISSGTGWLNLTCGAAITDPCYSVIVKQQGGGALSETIASGAYLNFSCLPGQWQCSSNTSAQNNCLTDPRQCSQFASDAALIAFWKGLSSTGSLLWKPTFPSVAKQASSATVMISSLCTFLLLCPPSSFYPLANSCCLIGLLIKRDSWGRSQRNLDLS